MEKLIRKANLLTEEALPYIQKFKDKICVVKYGGNAMISEKLKKSVMKDIALLKTVGIKIVIVHGGGPNISEEMKKAGLKPMFVNGLRVTDKATIKMIVKIFKGISKDIKGLLEESNVEGHVIEGCLTAKQKNKQLGLVGEITDVNAKKILRVLKHDKIPIISPIGIGGKEKYNINADTAATKIAVALKAEKLTILTDIDGVIENGKFISHLSIDTAYKHINNGVITKGMIPKVEACIEAVEAGCKKAHLINGTTMHSLLFEIFTEEGIGTEIVKNGNK